MKTFKDYVVNDTHGHRTFEQQYSCFISFVGKERRHGDEEALQYKCNMAQCRSEYENLLLLGNITSSHVSASEVLRAFVQHQALETIRAAGLMSADALEHATKESCPPISSKRPASEAVLEVEGDEPGTDTSNNGRPQKKVTFSEVEFPLESGASPKTTETTRGGDLLLLQSQFKPEDGVDQFFFDHPTRAWNNARAFCVSLLQRKYTISCKKAYQMYMKSLHAIRHNVAVCDEVREHARNVLKIREATFRSEYFHIDSELQKHAASARKRHPAEAGEEAPPHLALHFGLEATEGLDDLDGDFEPNSCRSETDSIATHDEDLTGEIPEPMEIDHLVGPGDFSCQVSTEGQRTISDYNITITIMNHRRSVIRNPYITDVDDLLLLNFVVCRPLLLKLFPKEIVDEAFSSHKSVVLEPEELTLVGRLSALATDASYDQLQEWFKQQPRSTSSIIQRTITLYFSEAGLWSDCNWFKKGTGDNEDTFTNSLIKPLMSGAFGDLAGCSFRWSRDSLRSGRCDDPDARLQFPDYQVSIRKHSIVLAEFKTAMVSRKSYQDDYVKLIFMGKKAVDGLYKAGYPTPVVLIHGRGMLIDVYSLAILSEASYHLQSLGTFHLISGPHQFALLLSIGPLLSAKEIARSTFNMLKSRKTVPTDVRWTRGSFDYKGITISM